MTQNNLPNNMDVVVVIDKEKLPEDVRKLLEENLPKDVQEKIYNMLIRPPPTKVPDELYNQINNNQINNSVDINNKPDNRLEDNRLEDNRLEDNRLEDNKLFAIQTGSVVGNIYTDGIYKKEEDSYGKKKDIKDSGGCC